MRKEPLENGLIYHIFSKSIAGYKVFRKRGDYDRFLSMLKFYQFSSPPVKFSVYQAMDDQELYYEKYLKNNEHLVEIIAYCIMPTHFHLVLKQLLTNGITIFMKNLLDSYSRYFNIKNNRKGPLWQGRFKSVYVDKNEYLLHLTRYIHLNPVSDSLVEEPVDWGYSSYREYIQEVGNGICNFSDYITLTPDKYREFVLSRKDYQRELTRIKHLIIEE